MYNADSNEEQKSAAERAFARVDVRSELDKLDHLLEELKVQHEQFFSGILPLPPDKLHNEIKRMRRMLMKAPFKNAEMNYRYQTLDNRYHTYRSYWERVFREREAGTYQRDVFKANLRDKQALQEQWAATDQGKAEGHLAQLFNSYRSAVEKQSGKRVDLDFDAFRQMMQKRVQEFKKEHGDKKLTFKVVVAQGRVTLKVQAKQQAAPAVP